MKVSGVDYAGAVKKYMDGAGTRGIVVGDLGDRRTWWNVNGHVLMPIASVAKMALVWVAMREHADSTITIKSADLAPTRYASVGQAWPGRLTIPELCALSIMSSDNPTANYLMGLVGGPHALTERLQARGVEGIEIASDFQDSTFSSSAYDNKATPLAIANFFRRVFEGSGSGADSWLWSWLLNNVRNTRIPALLPDEVEVAHKTGTLLGVTNDIGAVRVGETWMILVLMVANHPPDLDVGMEQALLSQQLFESYRLA